jgi:hypothetical protein
VDQPAEGLDVLRQRVKDLKVLAPFFASHSSLTTFY